MHEFLDQIEAAEAQAQRDAAMQAAVAGRR